MARSEGQVCIVLAAGFSNVERELEQASNGPLRELAGKPKALLPVAGKPILDHWWTYLSQHRAVSEIFIVCNAIRYKQFERWATAKGIDVSRVVNTGATAPRSGRGVLRDVELGIRRAQQTLEGINRRDVIVFAGDTLFFKDFDLGRILDFRASKGGSLMLYYQRREVDNPSQRGMCEVDGKTTKVVSFAEKPEPRQRGYDFSFVSPLFYILEPAAWQKIEEFNASQLSQGCQRSRSFNLGSTAGGAFAESSQPALARCNTAADLVLSGGFSFGRFVEWAVEVKGLPFFGMRMPGAFFLVGASAGYEEYKRLDTCWDGSKDAAGRKQLGHIHTKTWARCGVMGNPSDGFHGKTIAMTIRNFWASAELWESDQLNLIPHPLYDPSSFSCLADLHFVGKREGYYGGSRLLMATCKRFQELCTNSGIALPRKNFTLKYDTNIPRQVGLSGSSAIVTSVFKALMQFYDLTTEHISLERQPSLILSVESELGIQAGLQDRVVQVYQGLVYMDFDKAFMDEHGHGQYEQLSRETFDWVSSLPFFLAYESDPSDSGKIHSTVRARWDANEKEVVDAMSHFAELTVKARAAMEEQNHSALADLMDENFDTRRKIYGDACLGRKNLQMIEIARKCGAAAKLPGSGGAVIGLCRPQGGNTKSASEDTMEKVRLALEAENYVFCPLDPVMPSSADGPEPSPRPSASA